MRRRCLRTKLTPQSDERSIALVTSVDGAPARAAHPRTLSAAGGDGERAAGRIEICREQFAAWCASAWAYPQFRGGTRPNVSVGSRVPSSATGSGSASNVTTPTPTQAFEAQLIADAENPAKENPSPPTFDPLTERLLHSLRPELEALAREHIFTLRQTGADARIVQGTRTLREQARLYARGRTAPGPVVTNAPPGTSAHNYGAAYDIGFFANGRYLDASPFYTTIGPQAAPDGVVWGNNVPGFPPGDVGHYQLPNWQSLPPY